MKSTISLLLIFFSISLKSQTILNENFDNISNLSSQGWTIVNASQPLGTMSWIVGQAPFFSAFNGSPSSYIAVSYLSATGAGTISNWLITPTLNLKNGDVISFYTRDHHDDFADRLELRLSQNGVSSALPSLSSSSLGDFTNLALTINENLLTDGYPTVWTNYTYTISGLAQPTNCRIAFRYFVTDGGPSGNNSDYIGIDAVTVSSTLGGINLFNQDNVSIFPNPASDYLNIITEENIKSIQIFDLLGNELITTKGNTNLLEIMHLSSGIYTVKVNIDNGSIIKKIIKS